MIDSPKDYEQDEIIDVKLTRKDFIALRKIIEREEAASWFYTWITSHWIWVIGSGVLGLVGLYDYLFGKG